MKLTSGAGMGIALSFADALGYCTILSEAEKSGEFSARIASQPSYNYDRHDSCST
jgi:hypothetical protein